MSKPLLILSAILEEHKVIKKALENAKQIAKSQFGETTGVLGTCSVHAAYTSMGMNAAKLAAQKLIDKEKFAGVLVTGFCGGLSIPLKVTDVVIPQRVLSISNLDLKYEMDLQIVEDLGKIVLSLGHRYRAVPLITVPRVIETPTEKDELYQKTHAEAVDMETAEVISVCRDRGVPVASLKVIIDDCSQELPDFNTQFEKTGKMDHLGVASAFMHHPVLAMQLSKNMKLSGQVLGDILPGVVQTLARTWQIQC